MMSHVSAGMPHVEGVEHGNVMANDVRLHVARAGSGDPVLLVHGWPQHWWTWRRVIPELAGEFAVVAPDLRGFGWSDTPGHGYEPDTFVADLVALLDALEIERASVIGHDWGGYTSLLLAAKHPERVASVIAINTPHLWPRVDARAAAGVWRAWYALVMASVGPEILVRPSPRLARGVRRDLVHPEALTEADVEVYLSRLRERPRARASQLLYRFYVAGLTRPWAREHARLRLEVPGLILFGTQDRAVPASLLRGHERHADDLTIEFVEDSGHFLPEERPDIVARRARERFARPEVVSSG